MHHDAMYIRCVASWRAQWGGCSGDVTVGMSQWGVIGLTANVTWGPNPGLVNSLIR